jgi:hypothetical protein
MQQIVEITIALGCKGLAKNLWPNRYFQFPLDSLFMGNYHQRSPEVTTTGHVGAVASLLEERKHSSFII